MSDEQNDDPAILSPETVRALDVAIGKAFSGRLDPGEATTYLEAAQAWLRVAVKELETVRRRGQRQAEGVEDVAEAMVLFQNADLAMARAREMFDEEHHQFKRAALLYIAKRQTRRYVIRKPKSGKGK